MNIVLTSQIIGTISIFILFGIKLYLVHDEKYFLRHGRFAVFWNGIYVFFLGFLRVISIYNIATSDNLRIISGITSFILLSAVVAHLLIVKDIPEVHNEGGEK